MGKPCSKDLRGRFVALLDAGASASGAGKQVLVARSTGTRWGAIWTTEKRCEALPMGGDRRSADLEEHSAFILEAGRGIGAWIDYYNTERPHWRSTAEHRRRPTRAFPFRSNRWHNRNNGPLCSN